MDEKLPDDKLNCLLAPWRFSIRAPGFENRLVTALRLYERFPLDIVVTGGTPDANAQLASSICGPDEDIEDEEWETDNEDEEEEETDEEEEAEEWEEGDEEHSKLNANHQSSRSKRVRISDHTEFIGSGFPDFDSAILHRQIPNVRVWTVQGHPNSNSIIKPTNQHDSYDVVVVLTTEQNKEDHMWLKMELLDRDRPFFLVQAERDWDVVEEKPSGPCMTCAWERMRARKLELQKRSKEAFGESVDSLDDQSPSNASQDPELVKMKDIAGVLAEALPELRRKAFSQFLVAITRELRIPKLLTDDTQFVVSTALRDRKINQDDLDQISKLSQTRDLTDNPSKLHSILAALDHFRLDIGVLGETGCGSSSLVNVLVGLGSGNERAALTGVVETTKEAVEYPYPEAPNIHLWDLPGLGKIGDLNNLSLASSSSEAQRIASALSLCDVYILVSPLRLRSGTLQLLQQASSLGKECYLVLSMADLIGEKSIDEVRQWAEEILGKLGIQQSLFLVSAHHPETLDLTKLKEMLNTAFPSQKKVALARYVSKQLDEDVFWKRSDSCKFM